MDSELSIRAVSRRSGVASSALRYYEERGLIASQRAFVPFHRQIRPSWVMDLQDGVEAYLGSRQRAGVRELSAVARKRRKLEREHGEVRVVHELADPGVLAMLERWKSDQYRRTGAADHMAQGWVRDVLRLAHLRRTPTFAGVLSALYVGDRVVAAHFGIRSTSVWHYWYPAYDPAFGQYSPGLILLLSMVESQSPDLVLVGWTERANCVRYGRCGIWTIVDLEHDLKCTHRTRDVLQG